MTKTFKDILNKAKEGLALMCLPKKPEYKKNVVVQKPFKMQGASYEGFPDRPIAAPHGENVTESYKSHGKKAPFLGVHLDVHAR